MPVYLSFVVTMFFLPRGSMRGRASSSPRICGQLLHGQLDFEDVAAGLVAGLAGAVALAGAAERLPDVAVALADAAGVLAAVAELRDVDLRQGDARRGRLPFLPIISPRLMYLRQVALHLAADDLRNRLAVAFDLLRTTAVEPFPSGDRRLGPFRPATRRRCRSSRRRAARGPTGDRRHREARDPMQISRGADPTGSSGVTFEEIGQVGGVPPRGVPTASRLAMIYHTARRRLAASAPRRPRRTPRPRPALSGSRFLTSPRAKMLATKFSTSVAESSL